MKEESREVETASAVIPINEKRGKYVDFVIICKDKETGRTTKYGVEKAVIAASSSFFHDLFEACPNTSKCQKEELELMDNFTEVLVLTALQILSGDKDVYVSAWNINFSSAVIDFGVKYPSDAIVYLGLQKFCVAFLDMSNERDDSHSIYGSATIIKFISLWRLVITGHIVRAYELTQMFHLCFKHVWPQWCDWWNTTTETATISDFVSQETSKFFSGEDIYTAAEYIKDIQRFNEVIDLWDIIYDPKNHE